MSNAGRGAGAAALVVGVIVLAVGFALNRGVLAGRSMVYHPASPPGDAAAAAPVASSSASPLPVLLVPGWSDTGSDMGPLQKGLEDAGWPADWTMALSFGDRFGDNATHAREIAAAADRLLARTGADRLDIVAHSMGGLAARKYLDDLGGAQRVRRVVLLAAPNRGTWTAYLSFGGGRADMMPDSPFLDSLNAEPPVPAGVEALTVRTPLDVHILPPGSATLPGVDGVEVCCPTHEGMLRDPAVLGIVQSFLAGGVVPVANGPERTP